MSAWQPVINPLGRGYPPGFGPNEIYEFKRLGSDEVQRFRLADQSGYFNVFGLLWREPKPEPRDWTDAKAYRP